MKPRKLTMKAFGPYAGTEVIDFTKLEDNHMFLIHGPTGAGKTTILDGICYALYGETNGGERTVESMRSHFADEACETEVELVFSIHGTHYKIIRTPRFERAKKRGTGTTVEEGRALLYKQTTEGEELLAAKTQDVNLKIQELLTFKIDQFRQVIMIAQNKFRELLTVPSKERQKILQDIFETGIYQNVENKLDTMHTELVQALRERQLTYETILQQIASDETDTALNEYLKTKMIGNAKEVVVLLNDKMRDKEEAKKVLQQTLLTQTEALKTLQDTLIQTREQHNLYEATQQNKEKLIELEQQKPYYNTLEAQLKQAENLATLVPLEERMTTLAATLNTLKEAQHITKAARDEQIEGVKATTAQKALLEEQSEQIAKDRQAYQTLQHYQPKVEKIKAQQASIHVLQQRYASEQKTYEALLQKETLLNERIEKTERQLKDKETLLEQQKQQELLREKVNRVQEQKRIIKQKNEQIEATMQDYKRRQVRIKEEGANAEQLEAQYEQAFELWVQGQASDLAAKLETGEPCPVCGATTHPQKAAVPLQKVDRDYVQQLERERMTRRTALSALRQEQDNVTKQGKLLRQEINELTESLDKIMPDAASVDEAYEARIQATYKACMATLKQYRVYEEQLEQDKKEKATLTVACEQQRMTRDTLQTDIKVQTSNVESVMQELPEAYHTLEKLEAQLTMLNDAIQAFDTQKETLTKTLEAYTLAQMQYQTRYEEKTKQIEQTQVEYATCATQFEKEKAAMGMTDATVYEELKTLLRHKAMYQEQCNNFKTQSGILEKTIQEAAKRLETFDPACLGKYEQDYADQMTQKEATLLKEAGITQQMDSLTQQVAQLTALYDANKTLVKRRQLIGKLTDAAKGKNSKGLSFERYIQSSIFDEVLESANQKLQPMTGTRYKLFRTDAQKRRNAQAGLDIAVYDYYVGESRAVNTLSGGEGFMAALALALGLADVIARLAGASALETMFIDEGFGTLDEEALEMAIKVLLNLQDTGRLVGIISHVRELREQIPARLEIIAGKQGSHTRLSV